MTIMYDGEPMLGRNDQCWCGSGRKYKKCHEAIDARLQQMYESGHEVLYRSLLKTPQDIEGIKRSAAINIGVLDYVAEHIAPGVTTAQVDKWIYDYTVELETVRPGCIWLAESVHGAYIREMRRMGAVCSTDTDLYRAFDMTYDYDLWPCYEGVLKGETPLRQFTDLLTYQELTYPTGYVKARCVENHDTPRLASYLSDDRQLQNWLAFLYFRRGAAMLYGGTEFACRHQVSLFDKDDNFGDKARDLSDLLRRCKAMKTTLPLIGAVWYDCRVGAAIGHYDGPEGTALGVFDLSGSAASIPVDLPDGTYENRLGGTVTVTDGQLPAESTPVVI